MLSVSGFIAGVSSGSLGVQSALWPEKSAVNLGVGTRNVAQPNGRWVRRIAGPASVPHQSLRRTRTGQRWEASLIGVCP